MNEGVSMSKQVHKDCDISSNVQTSVLSFNEYKEQWNMMQSKEQNKRPVTDLK